MKYPIVSFIIPCYKLAHLLPECINSILSQSFCDFEVLIMDDCSPDNTREIVQAFQDPRVKYIRNSQNLGHLANYNKGIKLSRGKYVWLISADDRLRCSYVLERYVQLMDHHPLVGYVCCPGIGLQDGIETTLIRHCGYYGSSDKIFNGRDFIATSLDKGYGLLAPSVMVRKDCYDKISAFPLDMPHMGDVYLWFRWALEYDVAYMSEPMVNYRFHDLNIMKDLIRRGDAFRDEVAVLWRTKHHCEQKGFRGLADKCEYGLSWKYARAAAAAIYGDDTFYSHLGISITQCDQALRDGASSVLEYRRLRRMFFTSMGNQHWRHGAFGYARRSYLLSLHDNWRMPQVWLKILILLVGLGRTALFLQKLRQVNAYRMFTWKEGLSRWIQGKGCLVGERQLKALKVKVDD
ncbi:MAG: glycosyltransferase family 2 protein [Methylobacter sp.]